MKRDDFHRKFFFIITLINQKFILSRWMKSPEKMIYWELENVTEDL